MKKYFSFKQNDVDPSPEARAELSSIIDFSFKFAEYTLVAGVFIFLAITTQNWAVILIAGFLSVILCTYLLSLVSGLRFFLWKDAPSWWLKSILFLLDAVIFLGFFYVIYTAFFAVIETMKSGVGI